MTLPELDDVQVDDRAGRLRRRMAECKICQLGDEYQARITEARARGWGASAIWRYLTACGVDLARLEVSRHLATHMREPACQPKSPQGSTNTKPKAAKRTNSARS